MFHTVFGALLEAAHALSPQPEKSESETSTNLTKKTSSEMVMIVPSAKKLATHLTNDYMGFERLQREFTTEMGSGNFNMHFNVVDHIRSGRFGNVFSVVFKQSKEKAVAKILPRRNEEDIPNEIEWMKTFKHPNIVEYIMSTANQDYIQIIMACHGEITLSLDEYMNHMKELDGLGESIVKMISHQINNGLFYLHEEMSAVHLDLKLENIIINEHLNIRIIDFGSCCEALDPFKRNEKPYYGAVGTTLYMCPEMLFNQTYYGREADIWSFGVMIYLMLSGHFPFKPQHDTIYLPEYALYPPIRQDVSSAVKILLNGMLERDGAMRISVKQMQYQTWFDDVQDIKIENKYYVPFQEKTAARIEGGEILY